MKWALFTQALHASRRNPLAALKLIRHLPTMLRLSWRLLRDPRTGWKPRAVLLGTVAYFLSPLDLVPVLAFGPIGVIDDLTLMLLGWQWFLRLLPPDVLQDHLAALERDHQVES